jgi:hypothetical protein
MNDYLVLENKRVALPTTMANCYVDLKWKRAQASPNSRAENSTKLRAMLSTSTSDKLISLFRNKKTLLRSTRVPHCPILPQVCLIPLLAVSKSLINANTNVDSNYESGRIITEEEPQVRHNEIKRSFAAPYKHVLITLTICCWF